MIATVITTTFDTVSATLQAAPRKAAPPSRAVGPPHVEPRSTRRARPRLVQVYDLNGQPGQNRRAGYAGRVASPMATPLYELKAQFFRSLGHPARIRVLELLRDGERSVGELVGEVGLEASHLSQQLGVLRRAGLVTTRKQGTTVYYALATPLIAGLLEQTRLILTGVLNEQAEILRDLLTAQT